jgi:hypothetical protein
VPIGTLLVREILGVECPRHEIAQWPPLRRIATGERSACSSLGLHARPMPPACAPALKNVVRVSNDLGTVGQPPDCFVCKAFARNSVKHWRCDIDSIRNANTIDHSRCVFHIGHVEARVRVVKPAIRVNDVSVWRDLEAIA